MTKALLFLVFSLVFIASGYELEEKLPTKCHVCKHMTRELSEELGRSDKSNDVLYMGQLFQKEPKKIQYRHSELRLTEALENACSNVLDYKVHKDKPLPLRYEKVESTTFKTLKGLKKRGVKVDLGFPDQMWDTPDAEVTRLKSRCEQMVELYEDEISNWYWKLPETNLTQWLCVERVLKPGEDDCLNETQNAKSTDDKEEKPSKRKKKENKREKKIDTKLSTNKDKQENKKATTKVKDQTEDSRSEEERDKEKIQRLIRQQTEEQSRSLTFDNSFRQSDERSKFMSESKRQELRERLLSINDPDRLRREIRKIRTTELNEEEYALEDPWESKHDRENPEDLQRAMQRKVRNVQLESLEDFQREILKRVFELERKSYMVVSAAIHDVLNRYTEDAKQIRDTKELQKRLDDLNAFTVILKDDDIMHDEL